VQVEPIKPLLKVLGTKRLKLALNCEEPLSNVAFKLNLHHYNKVQRDAADEEDAQARQRVSLLCALLAAALYPQIATLHRPPLKHGQRRGDEVGCWSLNYASEARLLPALDSVLDLVSKAWYRIPFDQSELSISKSSPTAPTDSPNVRPGRDP